MGGCTSATEKNNSNLSNNRFDITNGKMKQNKTELQMKVVLLGEQFVGKSSIALRFMQNSFDETHHVTIGGAYLQPVITLKNNQKIKLHLWDTGGEERFRAMLKLFYRDSQAAVIVYDVSNPGSFQSVEFWLNELEEQCANDNLVIYIIGNKIDLPPEQIKITYLQASDRYIKNSDINVRLFETSAQTGKNINEIFYDLGENLYQQHLRKNIQI